MRRRGLAPRGRPNELGARGARPAGSRKPCFAFAFASLRGASLDTARPACILGCGEATRPQRHRVASCRRSLLLREGGFFHHLMRRMALCVSGHLRCAIPRDVRARNVFAGANSGHAARGRARQEAGVEPSAARHVPGAALLPFRPRLVRTLTAGSSRGDANAVSDRVAVSLQSDASNTEDTSRAHEAAASGKGAAASPTDTGLDSMRPPPVDWSKYADMEATSTSGRVRKRTLETPFPARVCSSLATRLNALHQPSWRSIVRF